MGWEVSPTPRPPLLPGKTQYRFYRRLGGPQGRSGQEENLVPTGIQSRTLQPGRSVAFAQRVGRGIALLLHDRGTRSQWSAARPGCTLPSGKTRYPFLQEAGWAPGPVWTGGKISSLPGFGPRPSSDRDKCSRIPPLTSIHFPTGV